MTQFEINNRRVSEAKSYETNIYDTDLTIATGSNARTFYNHNGQHSSHYDYKQSNWYRYTSK